MRPTVDTMLQQNNNNNYPCLNVSGSTREMLQKCSRPSLPFPSRLELGLGDLPLIRGLRAWALCSKNRRKAGGLLGGGQAPTAPPVGRGGSTSCPRPADVYLSGEWGRMGYGLPLGLDAGQGGIGALVTVATLKTSEGSGKTQTQCLFLRTEKGSCLYSTAKPGSGVTTGAASSVVGGWLRGKTGGGGSRDTPAGRRDHGPSAPAQTGVNRVRVRSGRRWRKSCNAASREKAGVSRERQQSGREHPAGETALEERQEERDKGGPDSKLFPSPPPDIRRSRQEREGAFRTPRCCHNASPKTCSQCGRRAQTRESQDEHEGGESPRGGVANRPNSEVKGMRRERQKNEEEEEEEELESSRSALAEPNPDLESKHLQPECDREEIRDGEGNSEEPDTQTSHGKDERPERSAEDTNSEVMKIQANNDSIHFTSGHGGGFDGSEELCGEIVNGFSDRVEAHRESEDDVASVDAEEEAGGISQAPAGEVSESSSPVEGSTRSAEHETCCDLRENGVEDQVADRGMMGNEELDAFTVNEDRKPLFASKSEEDSIRPEDRHVSSSSSSSSSPLTSGDEDTEQRVSPEEAEEIWRRERACNEPDDGEDDKRRRVGGDTSDALVEDDGDEVVRERALKEDWRLQESAGGCRRSEDEVGQTGVTHVEANETNVPGAACADPSTANPAPSLPPLESMATGLPCLEAVEKEEEEEEGVRVTAGEEEGGQEAKRRHGRELEEQGEEERSSTVATEEGRKQEEEEEEDEFGIFMQAEGEPAWSEGPTMSASVPCGSRETVALGNHAIAGESPHWTPGWTDSSFHQSDDTWSAFPQDSSDERRDVAGQWWPTSAVEESRDRLLTNQNLAAVFADAFPSLPGSPSSDLHAVPTLAQLLRGEASQDQGLLDSFHDLNKMICRRYKRANGVSRDLLLKTLHLERPHASESRPAPRTANRRLSPGLPSANQHAQIAAAKRRLSYDYNRNIME